MRFYSGRIPTAYETADFVLRPLTPAYVEGDLEALLASKEQLREWSASTWPEDDFDLDHNREDLQRHAEEFESGKGYAYTVLNPAEDRVEGCVYIYSMRDAVEKGSSGTRLLEQIAPGEAQVEFWIRTDRIADEGLLLTTLMRWFHSEAWEFAHVNFSINDRVDRRKKLYEEFGLVQRCSLKLQRASWLFYHQQSDLK